MNKPEFPKARLIREDFLPEQDPLRNYRIKKVTKGNGKVWYYPQKKVLWFWWNIGSDYYGGYSFYELANNRIIEDYESHLKYNVEFLEPTNSKYNPQPPLKFKKTN